MKVVLICILLSFQSLLFAAELSKIEALNGKVELEAPTDFAPMPKEILELKYPSSRRPTEVLSDKTGGVTLAFNYTQNPLQPSQTEELRVAMSKMFHQLHPTATWFRDEVIEQNGSKFMVLELTTPAIDTEIHNIMYGTAVDGRLLMVAFNTTREQAKEWLPIGKKIMASIQIKK